MVELMIAIIILGLGMLTVATMFPIAWTKARDLSEFTTQTAVTESASATLRLLTNVSNPAGAPSSFKGDVDVIPGTPNAPDPWVHSLHMENLAVDWTQGWVTSLPDPKIPFLGDFEDPDSGTLPNVNYELDVIAGGPLLPPVQVAFQDRIYPPMPPPPLAADPDLDAKLTHWKGVLALRRYCTAIFHKLDFDPTVTPFPTANSVRTLTVFQVTLRRGQSTHRYARQNPGATPGDDVPLLPNLPPNPLPAETAGIQPVALPGDKDVMFPVPWRVQIEFVTPPVGIATGIPAQAITNGPAYPTDNLVTDVILKGSYLIDELSGSIYRIASRELDATSVVTRTALLTLDQEVLFTDLDINGSGGPNLDAGEELRTVWVFPPPVERDSSGNIIGFVGPQPVVGIDVRTMTFSP